MTVVDQSRMSRFLRRHRFAAGAALAFFAASSGLPAQGATKTTKKSAAKTTKAVTKSKTTSPATTPATQPATSQAPTTAPTAGGAVSAGATKGGTLTYLQASDAVSMSPGAASYMAPANGGRMALVYDTLFWAPDVNGVFSPRIGRSISSADGITWTVRLRNGVKFSDGTAYDSSAVKFNWEWHAAVANRSVLRTQVDQIERMETPDPLTMVIVLKTRNFQFDTLVARQIGFIFSPKAMNERGADRLGREPVGAGPFLLKDWVRDSQQTYVRNPTYWDAPKPYLDEIVIKVNPDGITRSATFARGDADMTYASEPGSIGDLLDKKFPYVVQGLYGGTAITLNTARAPFDDVRMRQAMAYGFNRDDFNKVLYSGRAPMVDTIVPKGNLFYEPTLAQNSFDARKAQSLIDSYAGDKNNGRAVPFTITWNSALRAEGEYLQQWFNTQFKNLDVRLEMVDTPTLNARVANPASRNYQVSITATNFIEPELELYGYLRGGSSLNNTSINDPQLNAALDRMRESKNLASRKAAFIQVQQVFFDQVPWIYTRRQSLYHVMTAKVKGYDAWSDNLCDWAAIWKEA